MIPMMLEPLTSYRSVAYLFGIARCTVCKIVNEACEAIVQKLLPLYVRFPTGDSLKEIMKGFKDKYDVLAQSMVM